MQIDIRCQCKSGLIENRCKKNATRYGKSWAGEIIPVCDGCMRYFPATMAFLDLNESIKQEYAIQEIMTS